MIKKALKFGTVGFLIGCFAYLLFSIVVSLRMDEAWRAITINPARSLGIDSRVGSLEPGKDADFVLWTADPLTTIGGQAYMTVIDGRIVYQAE